MHLICNLWQDHDVDIGKQFVMHTLRLYHHAILCSFCFAAIIITWCRRSKPRHCRGLLQLDRFEVKYHPKERRGGSKLMQNHNQASGNSLGSTTNLPIGTNTFLKCGWRVPRASFTCPKLRKSELVLTPRSSQPSGASLPHTIHVNP